MHLRLVRGTSSSRKSTYITNSLIDHNTQVFEADQFFYIGPTYNYDSKLIGVANGWCYCNTILTLRSGRNVVVSNPFAKLWDLERYIIIPKLLPDVTISIIEIHPQDENTDEIPQEWIDKGISVEVIND